MDTGLAILLFCCTGGIGFIIYLIIYFSKPEDRCVFCNQPTQPYTNQEISTTKPNLYGQPQPSTGTIPESGTAPPLNFCPNCGEAINASMKFCENCGTELKQ